MTTINYDKQADALYAQVSKNAVSKTVALSDDLIVDFDKQGKIVGIELLDVSKALVRA